MWEKTLLHYIRLSLRTNSILQYIQSTSRGQNKGTKPVNSQLNFNTFLQEGEYCKSKIKANAN